VSLLQTLMITAKFIQLYVKLAQGFMQGRGAGCSFLQAGVTRRCH